VTINTSSGVDGYASSLTSTFPICYYGVVFVYQDNDIFPSYWKQILRKPTINTGLDIQKPDMKNYAQLYYLQQSTVLQKSDNDIRKKMWALHLTTPRIRDALGIQLMRGK
jgi:hypothetical protein